MPDSNSSEKIEPSDWEDFPECSSDNRQDDIFVVLFFWFLVLLIVLGVWKAIDLIILAAHHIHIS